ncbi:transcription termination/antitermination protein NusG [Thioclava pacifica]|uniref:NusG-like N-terminal domain-containing protein n=1 Tax=Thioclava pacifica DSM 10166 TaxID=1353537 RepID=A0A074JQU3_9RHOB|nr:transcriptional activator RfaH [Thioclava pacifica]KEO51732.1 hypothetical protein TP2_09645 [Thioclava pacifica DSM 10166]
MSFLSTETPWFAAQFKPNCAEIARRNLTRQGFQSFLPMHEVTRRRAERFETRKVPLFPGYLFLRPTSRKIRLAAANSTYGITRLVTLGSEPTPLPFEMIHGLIARCDADGLLMPQRDFAPGDEVTIRSGPFSDFVAQIETIDSEQRIWLLLDLMGRKTRISATPEMLG